MEKKQALSNGAPPPPYSTTPNGQNEASDLAKLWSEAIRNYEKKTNQPLRLDAMNNLDEVMKGTEKEIKGFDKFRHDKGKTDKVRSAFKDNLGWIQKVVKAAEAVGKAAGVGVSWFRVWEFELMSLGISSCDAGWIDILCFWSGYECMLFNA